jgi:valyl-tRNA synthetase
MIKPLLFKYIMALESVYNPKDYEKNIYTKWQQNKVGLPENQKVTSSATHSILMPPPNLTGDLHAGHAFQHYLMDTLSRYERINGKKSLWFPGVDHAGLQLEGVIDKLIVLGEFDHQLKDIIDDEVQSILNSKKRDKLPLLIKTKYPNNWLECAWEKVNVWRDNQKNQSAVLGDTPDYSRQMFTLDDKATKMVNFAFHEYWVDGLIYKNKYLINWSVGLQTALSEVSGDIDYITRKDPFINFYYKFEGHYANSEVSYDKNAIIGYFDNNPLLIATVRPETIHGDMGIAIHPEILTKHLLDNGIKTEDIKSFIEDIHTKNLEFKFGIPELGVTNVKLIISDKVDKDFGTGVLKITPASDMVDYDIWVNDFQGGEFKSSITKSGLLSEDCASYSGQTRDEGRLNIIYDLVKNGYVPPKKDIVQTELEPFEYLDYDKSCEQLRTILQDYQIDFDYEHNVTICERSKTIVEPLISDEVFIAMTKNSVSTGKSLQQHGLEGFQELNCYSEEYKERGTNFIQSLNDWCISRNLLWGHQFPVWYNIETNPEKVFYSCEEWRADDVVKTKIFIGSKDDLIGYSERKNIDINSWVQETKRLDTWFSSSLWPLTTFGYMEYKEGKVDGDFGTYYPTSTMTTAKEIFNIWVCRMVMLSKYFTSQLASSDKLYNVLPFKDLVIHPSILDDKGRKMSKSLNNGLDPVTQIEKYSSDALRMAMLSGMIPDRNMKFGGTLADRQCEKYRNFGNKLWNIIRFLDSKEAFKNELLTNFAPTISGWWLLNKYSKVIENYNNNFKQYHLGAVIDSLYDFLWNDFASWHLEYLKVNDQDLPITTAILKDIIQLLSPFMPFETEVLFDHFNQTSLASYVWETSPVTQFLTQLPAQELAIQGFQDVIETIEGLRSIKGVFSIPAGDALSYHAANEDVVNNQAFIKMTTKCELSEEPNSHWYQVTKYIKADVLSQIKDKQAEIVRTNKQIEEVNKQILTIDKMLNNPDFVSRASEETVESKKLDLEAREADLVVLELKLKILA